MSVEIKTATIEPIRQTFDTVARRFGDKRPPSRYQEASFDLQPMDNFHYKPIWDPEHEIYDARRTSIVMQDWDVFKDPRQYYYASYVIARSRLQEAAEKSFSFVEKNQLASLLSDDLRERLQTLVPLRHYEWAANQNNCFITAYAYGSSITQGAMYATSDRLGLAQYLSRIGLILDNNSGDALKASKQAWLDAPEWQPMRRLAESLYVTKDWFEVLLAQDLVLDGLVHPMAYAEETLDLQQPGAATVLMLTECMRDWFKDEIKWVDACVKVARDESEANAQRIDTWAQHWYARAMPAVKTIAERLYGDDAGVHLARADESLRARAQRIGITIKES